MSYSRNSNGEKVDWFVSDSAPSISREIVLNNNVILFAPMSLER